MAVIIAIVRNGTQAGGGDRNRKGERKDEK
jgi:hypothetical protein